VIIIYSPDHALHHGRAELIDGQLLPPVEKPERATAILTHVQRARLGTVLPPRTFGVGPVLRVHDPAFLERAWDAWRDGHGDRDALPLNWPSRSFRQRIPKSILGQLSYYSFDAATPITAGTYRAARAAVDVALTAAEHVWEGGHAFALCRPPGHHAARDLYGGYCFLNNAAVAAQALVDAGARVALLDVDYHHGNGTQAIFYDRADVLFVSLHADPAHEYPYFLGYADEQGTGSGEGFNLNIPLPHGTAWAAYREGLEHALTRIQQFAPDVLVVSLGVDTADGDPISLFRLQADDFSRLGEKIAGLRLPTLLVMEGGYATETLGRNVVSVLRAFG
jgi:acetoin utilization deacetylase AcuC-like enzyme